MLFGRAARWWKQKESKNDGRRWRSESQRRGAKARYGWSLARPFEVWVIVLGDNKITRVEGRYPIWEILDAPGHPAPINAAVPERVPSIYIKGVFLPAAVAMPSSRIRKTFSLALMLFLILNGAAKPSPTTTANQLAAQSSLSPHEKARPWTRCACASSANAVLTQT